MSRKRTTKEATSRRGEVFEESMVVLETVQYKSIGRDEAVLDSMAGLGL